MKVNGVQTSEFTKFFKAFSPKSINMLAYKQVNEAKEPSHRLSFLRPHSLSPCDFAVDKMQKIKVLSNFNVQRVSKSDWSQNVLL